MQRRFGGVAAVALAVGAPSAVSTTAVVGQALQAIPAQATTSGLTVRVTPNQELRPGQTVTVSGRGLPRSSGGSPLTWFVTECTSVVRGRMNPATDTPHCDIAHAQAIRVGRSGTFSTHYRLTTGIIGDGYCGTTGHPTCVIGVGTVQGLGTVVRIAFRTPPASPIAPNAPSTPTSAP
jgi:hypothetical protein